MAGLERARGKRARQGGNKSFISLIDNDSAIEVRGAVKKAEAERARVAAVNPSGSIEAPAGGISFDAGAHSERSHPVGPTAPFYMDGEVTATPEELVEERKRRPAYAFLSLSTGEELGAELVPVSEEEAAELGLEHPYPVIPQLRRNYAQYMESDPVKASGWNKLADETGIPRWMIEQDPRAAQEAEARRRKQAAYSMDFGDMAINFPATSNFLADPKNMELGYRSMPELVAGESVFKSISRSWKATSLGIEKSRLWSRYMMGDNSVENRSRIAEINKEFEAVGGMPEEALNSYLWNAVTLLPQFLEEWKSGGGVGAATGAAAAVGMALMGGQAGPMALVPEEVVTVPAAFLWGARKGFIAGTTKTSFELESGSAFEEFRQIPGMDEDVAKTAASLVGALNAGLELTELGTLAKSFPGGKAFLEKTLGRKAIAEALRNPTVKGALKEFAKKYGATLGAETAQEVLQEFVAILGSQAVRRNAGAELMSGDEIFTRLGETALQSVQAMSLVSGVGPVTGLAVNTRRAIEARKTHYSLSEAARAMDSSEVKALSPETAAEAVRENLKGTGKEVSFISGDKVKKFFQDTQDEELRKTFPEVLGVTEEEAAAAAEQGLDVEIATGRLLVAPPEIRDELLPFVRTEPDGMTQAEADAFNYMTANIEKNDALAWLTESKEREDDFRSLVRLAETKRMEFEAAGIAPDEASIYSMAYAHMTAPLARLWNTVMPGKNRMTPEAFAKRFPLTVERDSGGSVTGVRMNQTAWNEDGALSTKFGAERYYEPLNADVDPSQLVHIVNLTGTVSNKARNFDELKKWIDSLDGSAFATADNKAIVTLLHKNTKHVVESSRPFYRSIDTSIRDSAVNNIVDLIKSAVLIESAPNNKIAHVAKEMTRGQKKAVRRKNMQAVFHRLYVPINTGDGNLYAVRIVVFEENGKVSFDPLETQLYDVLIDKKERTLDNAQTQTNLLSAEKKIPSQISIHDLLKNVSDSKENPYFSQEHRGYIDLPVMAGDRQPARIVLTKDMNRSTVMHEMAHFYLWNLRQFRRYAEANNKAVLPYIDKHGSEQRPSERVARAFDDLEKLRLWWDEKAEDIARDTKGAASPDEVRSWLADGMETDTKQGQALDRAVHEYFARGFEAYLREGKAPSADLQGVFRRFKAWLCDIYQSITALRVELNDDVRGVFDRMLASDEAIEAFKADREIDSALGSAEDGSMEKDYSAAFDAFDDDDPYEAAKERMLVGLLGEMSPEVLVRVEARADEIRPGIVEQLLSEQAYKALVLMDEAPDVRLKQEELLDRYGEQLFLDMPQTAVSQSGIALDMAAKNLGYTTTDEMVADLRGKKSLEEEADVRMKAQLEAEFGSALGDEEALSAAAEAAFYSGEERGDELAAQLAAPLSEYAQIYAEDAAAKAATDDPGSRPNVVKWIIGHGGVKYAGVVEEFGKERAAELQKSAPFIFRRSGFGLDELAQELNGAGIPMQSNEALFNLLMSDNPSRSPLDIAEEKGAAAERERMRAISKRRQQATALAGAIKKKYAPEFKEKKGAAHNAAENIVSQMTIQEMRESKAFVRAEKESRKKAERALREGNEVLFRHWREKELVNHEVVRAMYRGQREALSIAYWLERYSKRRLKQTFGMDPRYLRQIDALLTRFDLRDTKKFPKAERDGIMKEIREAPSLASFASEITKDGTALLIPDWILENGQNRHFSQLMLHELRDVQNVVKNIQQAGRDEKNTISLAENTKISSVAEKIHAQARAFWETERNKITGSKLLNPAEDAESKIAKKRAAVKSFFDDQLNAEELCRALDGFDDLGPAFKYIFAPIRDAISREGLKLNSTFEKFRKLREECYSGNPKLDNWKITFDNIRLYEPFEKGPGVWGTRPTTSQKLTLTREQAICAALNMGNADNTDRLRTGWGWNNAEMKQILDSLAEEDIKYVQGVWDLVETLWPEVQKVHELMTGTVLEKVKAVPLTTKYGVLRGGYYPIVTDLRYSAKAAAQVERENVLASAPLEFAATYTKNNHRKARGVDVVGRPPLLSLAVLDHHIANTIHDFECAPALRDVRKILNHTVVHTVIEQALGKNANPILNKWLNDVAGNTKNNGIAASGADKTVGGLKSGTAMFALGGNIGGAVMQTLGYFPLAHRIGFVGAGKAVLRGLFDNTKLYEDVLAKSEFMREQYNGQSPEVRRLRQNWSATSQGLPGYVDMMLKFYPLMQNLCNVPGWAVAYDIGLKKFGNEKDAIAYADGIIRQTQSSSTIADLTTWERSGSLGQLTTMFYSWFRAMYQMQYEAVMKMIHGSGVRGRFGDFASYALYVLAGQSIAEGLIRGEGPESDDDDSAEEKAEKWVVWTAKRALTAVVTPIPGVRDIADAAGRIATGKPFGSYRLSPAIDALESVVKMLGAYGKTGVELWNGEPEEVDYEKLATATSTAVGYRTGLPNRKMILAAQALWDNYDEDKAIPWMYLLFGSGYKPKKGDE